jgi:hypothetical protein
LKRKHKSRERIQYVLVFLFIISFVCVFFLLWLYNLSILSVLSSFGVDVKVDKTEQIKLISQLKDKRKMNLLNMCQL